MFSNFINFQSCEQIFYAMIRSFCLATKLSTTDFTNSNSNERILLLWKTSKYIQLTMLTLTMNCSVKPSEDNKERKVCLHPAEKLLKSDFSTEAHLILERKDLCYFRPYFFVITQWMAMKINPFFYQAIMSTLVVTQKNGIWSKTREREGFLGGSVS